MNEVRVYASAMVEAILLSVQSSMTKLSVNLNKVALLRNQRDVGYPSVVDFARLVLAAKADGITVHPRPDERHIRRSDVYDLAEVLGDSDAEFNIEGNPTPEFLALVEEVRPDQVTLVPDDPGQSTSDHGWDPDERISRSLPGVVSQLQAGGMRVSLFMDPDTAMIERIHNTGADGIELYTGPWAEAFGKASHVSVIERFRKAGRLARCLGMGLNAGHDLNLDNLAEFLSQVGPVDEVSIGHAITADALRMGFPAAVEAYRKVLDV